MSQFIHGLQAISSYVGHLRSGRGHIVVFGRSECSWAEKGLRRFESVSVSQIVVWSMRSQAIKLRIRRPFGEMHGRLSYHPQYPRMSDTRRSRLFAPVAKLRLPECLPPPP